MLIYTFKLNSNS